MEYFKFKEAELVSKGGVFTAQEIWNQPKVWQSTYSKLVREKEKILNFWNAALKSCKKIILTGAGTSAYIGYSLEGTFLRNTGITTVSIPTTHLVTHATDYINPEEEILVISFARSGNSPESVAAVRLVDQISEKCHHFVITCDKEGELAKYQSKNEKFTFVLPLESNDKSLAMTSSYTSMLLTGILFARMDQLIQLKLQVDHLIDFGNKIIHEASDTIREIAKLQFERAVFLGSGPLFGTSTESHLKLQELTDGQIICKNDTFLAFRHGPKAVIDEKTLVMFLFSNKANVQRYERDFVKSMEHGKKALILIGVSAEPVKGLDLDENIYFSEETTNIEEEFLAVCSILPAQILGLLKSLELGLKPDNPSISGAISRVVEGVIIYEEE